MPNNLQTIQLISLKSCAVLRRLTEKGQVYSDLRLHFAFLQLTGKIYCEWEYTSTDHHSWKHYASMQIALFCHPYWTADTDSSSTARLCTSDAVKYFFGNVPPADHTQLRLKVIMASDGCKI